MMRYFYYSFEIRQKSEERRTFFEEVPFVDKKAKNEKKKKLWILITTRTRSSSHKQSIN